jgi:hypothetical protein
MPLFCKIFTTTRRSLSFTSHQVASDATAEPIAPGASILVQRNVSLLFKKLSDVGGPLAAESRSRAICRAARGMLGLSAFSGRSFSVFESIWIADAPYATAVAI